MHSSTASTTPTMSSSSDTVKPSVSSQTLGGSRSFSAPAAIALRGIGCDEPRPSALHVGSASATPRAVVPGAPEVALSTFPTPSPFQLRVPVAPTLPPSSCGVRWGYDPGRCGQALPDWSDSITSDLDASRQRPEECPLTAGRGGTTMWTRFRVGFVVLALA